MKRIINRIFIAIFAIMCNIRNRIWVQASSHNQKDILIVFQQLFGDAILISNSLFSYTKLFPKEKGYRIILLGRPSVVDFMQSVLPIPDDITLKKLDFKRFVNDFKYFRMVVKEYGASTSITIVPGTSLSAELFCTACNSKRRIGLVQSIPRKWPPKMVLFLKTAYTEMVRPPKEFMVLQRHRLLLNSLGLDSYKARLPRLLPQPKIIDGDPYCVVCPGASVMEKCWPTDRFIAIIDYIIERFHYDIHLCGGMEEAEFGRAILANARYPGHVINRIGNTTFAEWSAIVQHAELVIGNDSATVHLAAASRRLAICITGVYDKFQFFPYRVDVLEKEDVLPISILYDMPCASCRTRGYYSGYKNPQCKTAIQEHKAALCIDAITVEAVKEKIDQLLLKDGCF